MCIPESDNTNTQHAHTLVKTDRQTVTSFLHGVLVCGSTHHACLWLLWYAFVHVVGSMQVLIIDEIYSDTFYYQVSDSHAPLTATLL